MHRRGGLPHAGTIALEKDFQAIKSSARWRIGHLLVRLLEVLLLRGKPPLAIDHMGKLSDPYTHLTPRRPAATLPGHESLWPMV